MKKIISVVTFCLSFISVSVFAQTGAIKGTIKTSDAQPANFVSIGLKGTTIGTTANDRGEYEIRKINPGQYILTTSFVGLETKETSIEVKPNETTIVPEIILNETSLQLKEITVTAFAKKYTAENVSQSLRVKTPVIEMPQNIQVVTNATLKDQQVISMSDGLVRNVSGTARVEHWADLYTNIVSRGSQIQAFRNGFNVVNSYWGPLTEDISFVDHIEFVKGPAGFMLSNGDPSGLYNVVTKKPTGQTKGEASLTLGSYDLYRSTLDLDGKLSSDGKFLYRLNISGQFKKTHRPNEFNNRFVVAPVISYQLDKKTKLTFEYDYQNADMSNIGSYYVFSNDGYATLPVDFTMMPAGTPGTKINDHSFYGTFEHNLNNDWKLTAQLSHFIYNQEGCSMWPSTNDSLGRLIRKVDIWDAQSKMTMGQVFINGEFNTGAIHHRLLGGLDMASKNYLADWGTGHELDSADAPFDPLNPYLGPPVTGWPVFDRSSPLEQRAIAIGGLMSMNYSSLYLQDELGFLNNKLRLTLAGRFTDLSQSNWGMPADEAQHFTPRVGLSGSITNSFAVYALYDQAFIPQSGKLANGSSVKPITGNNMEVGIKNHWFNGRWNTTVAFYRITKNNELTADPKSPPSSGLSVELGEKQSKGIEFDLQGTIARGLSLIVNYAYTDSRVTKLSEGVTQDVNGAVIKVGDIVPGYSKHTANAWLSYKLQSETLSGLGMTAGCSWLGDRATYWGAAPDANKEMKDYLKVDAGLFWEKGKIRLAANVFNVLNEYLYSGSYESWMTTPTYCYQTEAPRNYRLSINYSF